MPHPISLLFLLLTSIAQPVFAQNSASMADLMRGMVNGLTILSQANTLQNGITSPSAIAFPGTAPWSYPGAGYAQPGSLFSNPALPYGTFPGTSVVPGMGGFPGMSPFPGLSPIPGMTPFASPWGQVPFSAPRSIPPGVIPPGWGSPVPAFPGVPTNPNLRTDVLLRQLQGQWETNTGGLLLVEGRYARLYLGPDQYQDLTLAADAQSLWISPQGSLPGQAERYQYRIIEGHVILREPSGKVLLLRRFEGAS